MRLKHYNADRTRFQIDHDLRRGKQPSYVDAERSHLNSGVAGPEVADYRALMLERRALTNPKRAPMMDRVAVMTGGIVTFGHLAQLKVLELEPARQDAMFREIAEALAARLGNELTAWAVHRDEESPHAHFQMPARRAGDGKLMSEVLKPSLTSELQDLAATVAQRYAPEIQRGERKANTKARNKSVKELHRTEAADLAARRETLTRVAADAEALEAEGERRLADLLAVDAAVEDAEAKVEKNERLAADAWARAQGEDERAAKAAKRAGVYENRVETARVELQRLQDEAARGRTALAELERRAAAAAEAVHERKKAEARRIVQDAQAEAARIVQAAEEDRDEAAQDREDAALHERLQTTALVKARDDRDAAKRELEAARAERAEAAEEADALRAGLDRMREKAQEARQKAESLWEEVEELETQKGALEAVLEPLRAAVAAVKTWKERLRDQAWRAASPDERYRMAVARVEEGYEKVKRGLISNEALAALCEERDRARFERWPIIEIERIDHDALHVAGRDLRTGKTLETQLMWPRALDQFVYETGYSSWASDKASAVAAKNEKLFQTLRVGAVAALVNFGKGIVDHGSLWLSSSVRPCEPPRPDPSIGYLGDAEPFLSLSKDEGRAVIDALSPKAEREPARKPAPRPSTRMPGLGM